MMSNNFRFNFKTLKEFQNKMSSMEIDIPIAVSLDALREKIEEKNIQNRLAIQPMEGCDSTHDGKPGELTVRRYMRYARSGCGILWFEGTAVMESGRSNQRQLLLCEKNKKDFKRLLNDVKNVSRDSFGYEPYSVLQLTHSGRYSNPSNNNESVFIHKNPYLDDKLKVTRRLLNDEEISDLENNFIEAVRIARDTGFDAVDIKSCHGYLISELLSGFTREGKYGGTFENRTKFLLNIVNGIRETLGNSIDIAIRINLYDAIPYPYGWGVDKEDYKKYDLTEPIELIKILHGKGVKILNVSAGDPHYNPHITRPYDMGYYKPPEHPLAGVYRLLTLAKEVQEAVPEMLVIASGFSWFREFGANVAAGCIEKGWFSIAGFGRQAFAYPNFAKDIIEKKGMSRKSCCITCSKCTEIMRSGGMTGCVVKDKDIYNGIYRITRQAN